MRIRLGYVAIALNLDKVTSSSTLTYSRYLKMDEENRLKKLKEVTYSNIEALEKILGYNIENNIHFYRMTSNFIPLATHSDVMWDYLKYFKKDLEYIGKLIKDNNLRVDAHPDQFNVINSDKESVVENTLRTLNMQVDLFEAMNYEDGKMVIHIGGAKGGKDLASDRFIYNLKKEVYHKYIEEIYGEWNEENQNKLFNKFMKENSKNIELIYLNDKLVGFYNGKNKDDNTFEIANICIMPEYQNNGIGTAVLKEILFENNDKDVFLQCFKESPAMKLFERIEFGKIMETEQHYIMKKIKK